MYCTNCGKKIDDNLIDKARFCPNCGSLITSFSNKYKILDTNPNVKDEIVIKLINAICFPCALVSAFELIYIFLEFIGAILLAPLFLVFFTQDSLDNLFYLIFDESFFEWFLLIYIVLVVIEVVCVLRKFKKIKKNNMFTIIKTNYLVKKRKYVLMAFFLGFLGVHRFVARDKLGGLLRIAILVAGIVMFSLKIDYNSLIGFILIGIDLSLALSDIIIAYTKTIDENKMIYV